MLIPSGPAGTAAEGHPTLYPSRLVAYGAASPHNPYRGCPAQYKAKYVDQSIPVEVSRRGDREFGSVIHAALFHMEAAAVGPHDALEAVWDASLGLDRWAEATDLLERYISRGGPLARYGTLLTEATLVAPLYEDPDHGPVYFAAILDWLGLDVNQPEIVHIVDYKSNNRPLDPDHVRVDVQLRGQDWLVHQCWSDLGLPGRPFTVAHMDGLRWKDVEVRYTRQDRQQWQEWAVAVARAILRDDEAPEIINIGCRYCPRKLQCDAYKALPGDSEAVPVRAANANLEELWVWREQAAALVKTLKSGMDEIDALLRAEAEVGPFIIGDHRWAEEDVETKVVDMVALHSAIGDEAFYSAAKVTLRQLDQISREHPDLARAIESCVDKLITGSTVKRRKVDR